VHDGSIIGKKELAAAQDLVFLMRYSGLRISDTVTMTIDRLDGKRLFLYTQKTGLPVYTVLPDSVVKALEATPRVTAKHHFWTGEGKVESIVRSWQARLKKLFDLAMSAEGPEQRHFTPLSGHVCGGAASRWRADRAVSQFSWGIRASASQSGITTPWVRSRQEQLEADVASSSKQDPVLKQENFGTNQVHSAKGPVN